MTRTKTVCYNGVHTHTRTKSREACTSHIKIRTVPQRERSDPHKVMRELKGFSHFCVEVYKVPRLLQKMSPWQSQPSTLCEPAQSKFTWTSHKGTFVRECARNYIKMGGDQMAHPDLTPAFIMAPYIPSPLSVDTLFRYVLRSSNSRKLVWFSLHTETEHIWYRLKIEKLPAQLWITSESRIIPNLI